MSERQRIAVFRPADGVWYKSYHHGNWVNSPPGDAIATQCGQYGDIPVPGDYFGDGDIRHAVFRPSNGVWYIKGHGHANHAQTSGNIEIQCGQAGDIPVPGDYFGEGRLRLAVFRPSNGVWYIKGPGFANHAQTAGNIEIQCGQAGDIPVAADYFGENMLRIAVFRPSNAVWYIKGPGHAHYSNTPGNIELQCGQNGDIPIPADYFGEGRPRIAVFRPSNGVWYIKGPGFAGHAQTAGNTEIQCGQNGDIPVPGYYHKNGVASIAVFRPANGVWYIKGPGYAHYSNTPGNMEIQTGQAGDIPVPVAWRKGNKPKHHRKFHTPQNWVWLK